MTDTAAVTDARYEKWPCHNPECKVERVPIWTTRDLEPGSRPMLDRNTCPACGGALE